MKGKHKNYFVHALATLSREFTRYKIADLVEWEALICPDAGCTAIIGVCSKLPDVLLANLRCLSAAKWPALKRVLLVVDCVKGSLPTGMEQAVIAAFPGLYVEFLYYTPHQFDLAERYKIGYLNAWLSWCIALKHTRTSHVLIHDYDALVLGPTFGERYRQFVDSGASVQGIRWYTGNGIDEHDHLVTTFEAFMDTAWLRSFKPVALFNKYRIVEGRSIDYDTTLDVQHNQLSREKRSIMSMSLDELVHPSQMICQYTMYRHSPGSALPCFSIPMIPFFCYLSGRTEAIEHATRSLEDGNREDLDLLGDQTRINLSMLNVAHVHWALRQIVQACCALSLSPDHRIYRYGQALYRAIQAPIEDIWAGEATQKHRAWIDAAAPAGSHLASSV